MHLNSFDVYKYLTYILCHIIYFLILFIFIIDLDNKISHLVTCILNRTFFKNIPESLFFNFSFFKNFFCFYKLYTASEVQISSKLWIAVECETQHRY